MAKAWGGRFHQATDSRVEAFTESISFDRRLYAVDIRGSMAHATMLAHCGLISAEDRDHICAHLDQIREEIASGQFTFRQDLEDIHMHIENALITRIGDVGRRLHTGRSRNDQVSTDLKLFTRDAIDTIDRLLTEVQRAFLDRCDTDSDVVMPGYTHLQRASPSWPHTTGSPTSKNSSATANDSPTAANASTSTPSAAAALAGTSLPIDRALTARLLGFDSVAANSLDVSSDRDYLVEFTFCLALIATHLSTWAEEWIIWFTTEFSFLKLPDAYTTGSSIMPQKRNPDVLELIRGRTARVDAAVPQLLILLKSLPMAYNRDLQEDKLALFGALDALQPCLELAPSIIAGAELRKDRIAARLEDGFLDATVLMEYLIRKGVPMRTGHETVGRLVAHCEARNCRLADLPLAELQEACPKIEADVASVLGTVNANLALQSFGSGGRAAVNTQIDAWKKRLPPTTLP
ncbi:MAG UNVERIFIED_CONTAM: argininosuccinate lyase [Planctomycetaceae bacterium]